MDSQTPTIIFDICDTLYYSNTTHDFIRFAIAKEPMSQRKIFYNVLNAKYLPFRYLLIFFSVATGRDILRSYNVSLLKGVSRTELAEAAKRFVHEFLSSRKIDETQEMLKSRTDPGTRIVLCSASIEPVVEAIANELGIKHHVGTSLRFNDDIFTGRIFEDITGKKLSVLKENNLVGRLTCAVSDNLSDLELLSEAEHAFVVVHRGKKAEFWQKYNFEIIYLNS